MKNLIWFVLICMFGMPAAAQDVDDYDVPKQVTSLANGDMVIEDFEDEMVGDLPARWYEQKAKRRPITYPPELKETYHYEILQEEGNKFLRFDGVHGKHLNFPLLKIKGLDLYETPILKWDWRAIELPEGANESDKDRNDAVASIYVVFDMGRVALFKKVPKSIRYTWSSTLDKGTEISAFFGNQKIVVVESGKEQAGSWRTFQRNIVEDYKRLFGDDPPDVPIALLILSDGNDTKEQVIADYDNIVLSIDQ